MVYIDVMLKEDLKSRERADFRKPGQRGFAPPHINGFKIDVSFKEAFHCVRSKTLVGADDGHPFGTSSFVE